MLLDHSMGLFIGIMPCTLYVLNVAE